MQVVREDILFGKEFDSLKYKQCIKAAAMLYDLTLLPNKDCMSRGCLMFDVCSAFTLLLFVLLFLFCVHSN